MDILINPVLPADLGFTSWERHTEVLWQAYPGTAMWIEAQVAQRNPHLLAVIGGNDETYRKTVIDRTTALPPGGSAE